MPAKRTCHITVHDASGKPWTMAVEASSLYEAVFGYNAHVLSGHHRDYPQLQRDTEIEVRLDDGRVFHTTFGKAFEWANRIASARATRRSHL